MWIIAGVCGNSLVWWLEPQSVETQPQRGAVELMQVYTSWNPVSFENNSLSSLTQVYCPKENVLVIMFFFLRYVLETACKLNSNIVKWQAVPWMILKTVYIWLPFLENFHIEILLLSTEIISYINPWTFRYVLNVFFKIIRNSGPIKITSHWLDDLLPVWSWFTSFHTWIF